MEQVTNTRFLGVILDEQLNFKNHLQHIRSKVAKGIYVLGRAKKYFDEITLKELYYAFIHPYFSYCNEVWGGTYSSYIDPLLKLQKRAIRIVAGVARDYHTLELFQNYNIIPVDKLHKYSLYIFLFKLVNKKLPVGIQSSFIFNNQVHHYFTRQADDLHIDKIKSESRRRALRHQVSILYSSNSDIDYAVSFPCFKFIIKTMLLNSD